MSKPDLRSILNQLNHVHPALGSDWGDHVVAALDRHITTRALRSRSVQEAFAPQQQHPDSFAAHDSRLDEAVARLMELVKANSDAKLTLTAALDAHTDSVHQAKEKAKEAEQAAPVIVREGTLHLSEAGRKAMVDDGDDGSDAATLMAALAGQSLHIAKVRETWDDQRLAIAWAKAYQLIMTGHPIVPPALRRTPGMAPVPSTLAELRLTHMWRLTLGATADQMITPTPTPAKPTTTPVEITQDQALLMAAHFGPFGVRQRANRAIDSWTTQRATDTRISLIDRLHPVAFPTSVNGPDPRD